jgi:hypothetical protein
MLEVLLSFGGIEALIPLMIVVILIGAAAGLTRKFDFLAFLGISTLAGVGSGFSGRGSIKGKSGYGRTAGGALAGKAPVKSKVLVGKGLKKAKDAMQTRKQMKQERDLAMADALGTATTWVTKPKIEDKAAQMAPHKYGRVRMVLGYLPSIAGMSWIAGLAYGRKKHETKRGRLTTVVNPTGGATITREGRIRPVYGRTRGGTNDQDQQTAGEAAGAEGAGTATPAFVKELSGLEEKRKKLNDEYNKKAKEIADKRARLENISDENARWRRRLESDARKRRLESDARKLRSDVELENAVLEKRIEKLKNAKREWYDALALYAQKQAGTTRDQTEKRLKEIQKEASGDKGPTGRLKDFLSDNAKIVGAAGNTDKIRDIEAESGARKAHEETPLPRGRDEFHEDWAWERDRKRREKENARETRRVKKQESQ